MFFMRNARLRVLAMAVAALIMNGCSSGGGGSSNVTLTGTVQAPTAGSSNISALVASGARASFVEEAAAPDVEVDIYNLSNPPADGEPIGEGTTGSDGTFSITASGGEVDEGDQLLVVGDEIFALVEMPAEGESVDLGEADFDSTLAWQAIAAQLEEAGLDLENLDFGSLDLDDLDLGMDIGCYVKLQEAQWEFLDATGEGLGGDLAILENLGAAAILAGLDVSMEDLVSGEVDDETLALLAAAAEDQIGGDADTYLAAYDQALESYGAIADTLEGVFANEETAAGISALFQTSDETDACAAFEENEEFLQETMEVILACEDADTFTSLFGTEDGFSSYYDYMNTYYIEGGTEFTEFNPEAFVGIFESYAETYGGVWTEFGTFADDLFALTEFIPDNPGEDFDYVDFGASLGGQFWDAASSGETLNPDEFDDWCGFWTYQVDQGFDPSSFEGDYDYYGAYVDTATGTDFSACLEDPEACASGFNSEDFQLEGFNYVPPPPEGAECGNFVCDFGESGENCLIDCGSSTPPEGSDMEAGGPAYPFSCEECQSNCSTNGYDTAYDSDCTTVCENFYPGICS